MAAALLPLRAQEPGLIVLIEQIGAGIAIYAVIAASFDVAHLRTIILARFRPMATHLNPS